MPHRSALFGAILLGAFAPATATAQAGNQASAVVRFEITPLAQLSVSGDPGPLLLYPSNGSSPDTIVDATTTWSVVTNVDGRKITASIDAAMPPDVRLAVRFQPPPGAISPGAVPLGVDARDIVTGLARTSASGLAVAYSLSASIAAGTVRGTRTVTFTITGDV